MKKRLVTLVFFGFLYLKSIVGQESDSVKLEPTAMFEKFRGDKNYADASFFDGRDETTDVGLNLISKQKK